MEIGSISLQEVNLTIPQDTSLNFTVVHKDEDGHVVDHSGSTVHMALQTRDGKTTYDLSECCAATAECIAVNIPATATKELPVGKKSLNWDMIVTTQAGGQIRMCSGIVNVYDTYAMDEVG